MGKGGGRPPGCDPGPAPRHLWASRRPSFDGADLALVNGVSKEAERFGMEIAAVRIAITRDEIFEPMDVYKDEPVLFCLEVLGVTLTQIQIDIVTAVRDQPRVSVAACYASGKTYLAAAILLWWLYSRTPAMVVTTAPTKRQVEKLLWRYVRRMKKRAKRRLIGRLLTTELRIDEDQMAFGFTGSSGHSVQGVHESENVLFIEDEAAGMRSDILEDFEGITTGEGSRHLKIGNPTSDSGPFYDSHEHPDERLNWTQFNISAHQTPNVLAGEIVVKGLVDREWVDRIEKKYGVDSPFWITKVLGRFCRTAGEKVVPPAWRDLAKERFAGLPESGLKVLGVDVGRSIDETVFVLLHGRRAGVVKRMQTDDLTLVADEIESIAVELGADRINIDGTGMGIGVCDIIQRRVYDGVAKFSRAVVVNYCVFGKKANDSEDFPSILDETHWLMRKAFDPTNPDAIGINPEDVELCEQVCWRGWSMTTSQKWKAWTKKEVRKEYGKSCDDSDALMLCFWASRECFVL